MPVGVAGINNISLKSLGVMSNFKGFAMQDSWPTTSWINPTHYIDLYDTHMDQQNNYY